jgi:hypothetical protein
MLELSNADFEKLWLGADLQSPPIGRSGNPPGLSDEAACE